MNPKIRVDQEHFDYLRLQKGSLDDIAHDRPRWHQHYEADLRETYRQIAPWIPNQCAAMLDVGSGLGGIDVLLARHYAEHDQAPQVALLDGHDDEPVMTLHRRTFNNMRVAREFQVANGLPGSRFTGYRTDVTYFERSFDLIMSFGSWCFHYPPEVYLARLCAGAIHHRTVIILDVRRNKLSWMGDLERVFELVTMVAAKPKWSRCVFLPRAAS
jgi:SAM-dependent methyltransferase